MIIVAGTQRFFDYPDPWGFTARVSVFDVEQYVFVHEIGTYKFNDHYTVHDAKILADADNNHFFQIFDTGTPLGYHDKNKKWWYIVRPWQRYIKNERPFLFHNQLKG